MERGISFKGLEVVSMLREQYSKYDACSSFLLCGNIDFFLYGELGG
jgi:hypothetical protein